MVHFLLTIIIVIVRLLVAINKQWTAGRFNEVKEKRNNCAMNGEAIDLDVTCVV